MRHYFIDRPRNDDEYFDFHDTFLGQDYLFHSCNDLFSKDRLDEGSKTLISAFLDNVTVSKNDYVLDLCCGYGAIGIVISKNVGCKIDMCDINQTAISLCKKNVDTNRAKIQDVFVSDMYSNVDKQYNYIITNPPIKTGKKLLFSVIDGAKDHLVQGGSIILVIRKDLGAESLKKHMIQVFGNCETIKRNKGYHILLSKK